MLDKTLLKLIEKKCGEKADEILRVSRYIHSHPETGLQEYKACACLTSLLRKAGFAVEEGIAGLPTAFRACFDSGRRGPSFAFLAEYDALPEIGHGCGHNLIAASSAGAALVLAGLGSFLQGRIIVLGTPAEETYGGKAKMVQEGFFSSVDATAMLHPSTENIINPAGLANASLTFRFKGKSAHAAASPEKGINALEGVLLTFASINALRQHLKPDCLIHGIITNGGSAPNIIPGEAEAQFYVRAPRKKELIHLAERVKDCARGAAVATATELIIEEKDFPCDDILNNPVLTELLHKYMLYYGLQDILPEDSCPGSSDFGNVSHAVPAAYGFVATAPPGIDLHTAEFAHLQTEPLAEANLLIMVKVLAAAAAEFLTDPAVCEQAWRSFRECAEDS